MEPTWDTKCGSNWKWFDLVSFLKIKNKKNRCIPFWQTSPFVLVLIKEINWNKSNLCSFLLPSPQTGRVGPVTWLAILWITNHVTAAQTPLIGRTRNSLNGEKLVIFKVQFRQSRPARRWKGTPPAVVIEELQVVTSSFKLGLTGESQLKPPRGGPAQQQSPQENNLLSDLWLIRFWSPSWQLNTYGLSRPKKAEQTVYLPRWVFAQASRWQHCLPIAI